MRALLRMCLQTLSMHMTSTVHLNAYISFAAAAGVAVPRLAQAQHAAKGRIHTQGSLPKQAAPTQYAPG